jgi:hypothetical protein
MVPTSRTRFLFDSGLRRRRLCVAFEVRGCEATGCATPGVSSTMAKQMIIRNGSSVVPIKHRAVAQRLPWAAVAAAV